MDYNFSTIVEQFYAQLMPWFMSTMRGRYPSLKDEDIEDLYSDAFMAINRNLLDGRVLPNTNWRPYILTIGINLANKRLGRDREIPVGPMNNDDADEKEKLDKLWNLLGAYDDDLQATERHQIQEITAMVVSQIPEPCATILKSFYYYDLSMKEIAEELKFKDSTVAKTRKNQCMNQFTPRLVNALALAGFDLQPKKR